MASNSQLFLVCSFSIGHPHVRGRETSLFHELIHNDQWSAYPNALIIKNSDHSSETEEGRRKDTNTFLPTERFHFRAQVVDLLIMQNSSTGVWKARNVLSPRDGKSAKVLTKIVRLREGKGVEQNESMHAGATCRFGRCAAAAIPFYHQTLQRGMCVVV
ncbi:hypothetical protein NPIL_157701 [Nephila pilipes]|uniref:Uncharacterized protein n=1 Tax=Nephila pilipes TaxID=299642 RepID=A0A8X6QJN7_NEPPI|nr:hypothetical protein NPIL_157701 [Nephila pilipes]